MERRAPPPPPPPPRPTALAAARGWAYVATRMPLELGAALAVAPLSRAWSQGLQRRSSERVLRRHGIDVVVHDRSGLEHPRDRGVLFVHLNQQTLLEVPLYAIGLPPPFALVMNVEFAALPIIGWLALAHGSVPIIRQRPAQAKAALKRVVHRLAQGESFAISIEGRRSEDGALSPFKKGPAVLAIEAQCDIVPFMTHGEWALWPRGDWRIRPGRVDFVLYPKIPTRGLTYADRDDLVARLRSLAESETARWSAGRVTGA